jgi:hypothetical protein
MRDLVVDLRRVMRPDVDAVVSGLCVSRTDAQRFDPDHARLSGEPFSIGQNVLYYGPNLSASFSISENGVLVYQAAFPNSDLKWYDGSGRETGKAGAPMCYWGNVRISHDGRRVGAAVWSPENGATSIWTFHASGREAGKSLSLLMFIAGRCGHPTVCAWRSGGLRRWAGRNLQS